MTEERNREEPRRATSPVLRPGELDAAIFDLDGVLTDTAEAHFRSWKQTFDELLRRRAGERDTPFEPFTRNDHRRHVRGKPRYEGARAFLGARGIELPFGTPDDDPGLETVCSVGNRKNERYRAGLEQGSVAAFPSSVRLVRRLRSAGVRAAVVSSSRNGRAVLESAGIAGLFAEVVDGSDLARDASLTGKPAPDLFLLAARRLNAEPERTLVVEDSAAGAEAGRRGGFGIVVGVARDRSGDDLASAGANLVVSDLGDVPLSSGVGRQAERDRADGDEPAVSGRGPEA